MPQICSMTSNGGALQVAQELAECISLPDGTVAQLSVARSLTRADSVSIEPFSEDDWEILESRADLAEETILQQVFYTFCTVLSDFIYQ
jgi:peroxin-1